MSAHHQLFVDELYLLPEILSTGFGQRPCRIEMAGYLENTGSDGGEETLNGLYDAVVKGVDGAIGGRLADAADHQRLDVSRLDLDENRGLFAHRVEDFAERRDEDPIRQRK